MDSSATSTRGISALRRASAIKDRIARHFTFLRPRGVRWLACRCFGFELTVLACSLVFVMCD